MPGLTTNVINLISDNLRDRYRSGFPILKELVQNADDAGATQAVFGLRDGLNAAKHPLLKGPALYFFNDGRFRESDQRAILSFAENSKAGEIGTIGKFGLGMKSAFHLCEAFFYVAWNGAQKYQAVINPWNGGADNLHPDWEDVQTEEWGALRGTAAQLSAHAGQGFLLWVPLRKRAHLHAVDGAETGAIIERFPGDALRGDDLAFLNEHDLQGRLSLILPLLRNLETIAYRPYDGIGKEFSVRIDTPSRLERDANAAQSTGRVHNGSQQLFGFYGQKVQAANGSSLIFSRLKSSGTWPKTYYRDELGYSKQARDKSQPEGAVVVGHQDGVAGGLTLSWAVFLPLDDQAHVFRAAIPGSSRHYHVMLHGQFFVDAGRRGIHEFPKLSITDDSVIEELDESRLRQRWNRELADRIVLPLLLPVLDAYVREHGLPDEDVQGLTKALTEARAGGGLASDFISIFQASICRDNAWVRRIDQRESRWMLLPIDGSALRPLPGPPASDPSRPWKALPALVVLEGNRAFIDEKAPRISTQACQWPEEDLVAVLKGSEGAFASAELLDYVGRFLMTAAGPYRVVERVQDALVNAIRAGLLENGLQALRQRAAPLTRLINCLLPERRVAIGAVDPRSNTAITPEVFDILWRCKASCIVVPKDFDPDGAAGKPSDTDISMWLAAIDKAVRNLREGDSRVGHYLRATEALLEEAIETNRREQLLRVNSGLRVLRARDARAEDDVAVSLDDLQSSMADSNLVGFGQGTTLKVQLGMAPALAQALKDEKILVVRAATVLGVLDNAARPGSAADATAVLRCVGVRPKALVSEAKRKALVAIASDPQSDAMARCGLRYLLHGSAQHFAEIEAPLWVAGQRQSAAWEKLWRQVANIAADDSWNVVSRALVGLIPPALWDVIGIREIDPAQVVGEIKRTGAKGVDGSGFTSAERLEVLRFIETEDAWRMVPFHETLEGDLCSIDSNSFLDQGLEIPEDLRDNVSLIAQSQDTNLAQKQARWVRALDSEALADIALNSGEPSRYWRIVLEAIQAVTLRTAYTGAWLPLRRGHGAVSPANVVDIPEVAEHVQRLAAQGDYACAGIEDLHPDVRSHPGFQRLRERYFAKGDEGLEKLARLMASIDGYAVGSLMPISNEDLVRALPALRLARCLPAWDVLADVARRFGVDVVQERLLPKVRTPIPLAVLEEALTDLASRANGQPEAGLAFDFYLGLLAPLGTEGRARLRPLLLRTAAGVWRGTGDLCFGASGADPGYVLDSQQAGLLSGVIVKAGSAQAAEGSRFTPDRVVLAARQAPDAVQQYFRPWRGMVAEEHIGGVLSFFGPHLRGPAKRYLGTFSHQGVLDEIDWQVPSGWMNGLSAVEALERLEVGIDVVRGKPVAVTGILGDEIEVPLAEAFDNLIVGQPWWAGTQPGRGLPVLVQVRSMSPSLFSGPELSALLQRTGEYILRACCDQHEISLGALWEKLSQSDQLEIDVAQAMLLEHMPFYLRQLGAHRYHDTLRSTLDEYQRSWERLVEAKSSNKSKAKDIERLSIEVRERLDAIRVVLTSDASVQAATLEAIRSKLADYQYDVESIPFELFQNADDALVELSRSQGLDLQDSRQFAAIQKLVVHSAQDVFRIAHWGRPINARMSIDGDGHELGFQRDLQKMLVVSSSDKPLEEGVTGKFGLGFKSVFLICDRPKLLSGQLRVEILGGVLPVPWQSSEAAANWLHEQRTNHSQRGTLIELSLRDGSASHILLGRFSDLAGMLCVFANAIRKVELIEDNTRRVFEWTPTRIHPKAEIGEVALPDGTRAELAVFRLTHGSVAIKKGALGFVSLPDDVPSLWVTTPTREEERYGFAVSARFALDAGRARLAGDATQNFGVAKELGRDLGETLVAMHQQPDAKVPWHRGLGFPETLAASSIWGSLWQTLAGAIPSSGQSASSLGGEIALQAVRVLADLPDGVPNGLPADFSALVDRRKVNREVTRPWQAPGLLHHLKQFCELGGELDFAGLVSSEIASLLRLVSSEQSLSKLALANVIGGVRDRRCTFPFAQVLERLCESLAEHIEDTERRLSQDAMAALLFQSRTGQWSESRRLLSDKGAEDDEKRLVGFVPDSALIHDQYDDEGKAFFRRCRPRFEVSVEELVSWVVQAQGAERRRAALRYLLTGDRAQKLGVALRNQGLNGTWLEGINDQHPCFEDWEPADTMEVLRQLSESVLFSPSDDTDDAQPNALRGAEAITRIYEWWEGEGRAVHRDKYLEALFPQGRLPDLRRDAGGRYSRDAWMKLFTLGALQRIGRVKDAQNRGFVELLEERGWWAVISAPDPRNNSAEWMRILEEFADSHIDDEIFSLWMDSFPRLFRLARWLDQYVELFISIDRRTSDQMRLLLTPQADAVLQGGGVTAPSVNRTLRMGQHLVIREMLRANVLRTRTGHAYAYMPSAAVRNFLTELDLLGDFNTSDGIYAALRDAVGDRFAIFGGDFDIPLRILAWNSGLAWDLLKIDLTLEDDLD